MSEPPNSDSYKYKAFISYSHAADGELAPAVQNGLRRFGQPWYRRPSIQVFRDETGLGVTPDLWGDVQQRLEESEWFILLASPAAAESAWVDQEIEFWLQHRSAQRLLIALTAGELRWSKDAADFDWNETNALPRRLEKVFEKEPLWADLSWAKTETDLSLRRPRFLVEIAKLVAGLRQVPLERVFDEAAAQHRKALRLLRAGVAALAVFAVAALGTALVAFRAKQIADGLLAAKQGEIDQANERLRREEEEKRFEQERRRKEANAARLAAKAVAVLPEDRELSMLLALEAVQIAPTPEAEDALRQTLLDLVAPVVLRGHQDAVYGMQFSPDGRRLLTWSADGTVRLWDAGTGTNVLTWTPSNDGRPGDMAFASFNGLDGTKVLTMLKPETLAVGYWEGTSPIQVHDATTGRMLASIPDRFAVDAALSPDGAHLVTAGFDSTVKMWDVRTGTIQFACPGHEGRVVSASFSSSGEWFLTDGWDTTVRIWDAKTGRGQAVLNVQRRLAATTFDPDGTRVLTLSVDESGEADHLQLWDWVNAPGGSLATFTGHEGLVDDATFSPDGRWLVTASRDKTARIWDTASGKCLHVLSGHEESVNGVAVSPDGRWVVTVSDDRTALIWEAATGRRLIELGWDRFPRTSVAFSPDGKRIVTGTTDGAVLLYTCEICGRVDDLEGLARARVKRELTEAERDKYLGTPP